jgi:hypothetical protein
MQTAAVIAAVLIGVVTVFQLALALGLPAGRAAWGGRHQGKLPTRLRLASGIAGLIVYPVIILVVLETGEVIDGPAQVPEVDAIGMWVLTALFTVGALANLASQSKIERVWVPVSLTIAVCCAIVATGI